MVDKDLWQTVGEVGYRSGKTEIIRRDVHLELDGYDWRKTWVEFESCQINWAMWNRTLLRKIANTVNRNEAIINLILDLQMAAWNVQQSNNSRP